MVDFSTNYKLGSLFPRLSDGSYNILLSSDLYFAYEGDQVYVRSFERNDNAQGLLEADLEITSNPVRIPGLSDFLNEWFIPQLTAKDNPDSLFTAYFKKVTSQYTTTPRNNTIEDLLKIGYIGKFKDNAASSNEYWNSNGSAEDELFKEIKNLDNYDPGALWNSYNQDLFVRSRFDIDSLLQRISSLVDPSSIPNPNLWYPSMLYTYGVQDGEPSYPGPVLMVEPGNNLKLNFENNIRIGDLSDEQNQQASLISNSTYGNSAGDGLGASNTTNYHLHGSHTNPTGFGDNVLARYTTGQSWTTEIELPEDHGQGSYWYHPHYHPSVNQMVYGGMSGPFQVGDPLSKVKGFEDVPRNMAVLKTMDLGIDPETGEAQLSGFDNLGKVVNRMTMVTVNGEYQPVADAGQGGWQSLTLSNQTNQAFYNLSLKHKGKDGKISDLPLYIYGEDGHQFPQIRAATAGSIGSAGKKLATGYTQASDLLELAPGKRFDILFYLPDGETELTSTYSFKENDTEYTINNAGAYPDLSSQNTGFGSSTGSGPLAYFNVVDGTVNPSKESLDEFIDDSNGLADVQNIRPTTSESEYDPSKIPSVNLFSKDSDGNDEWVPIRNRQFNWSKGTLVGPPSEYDQATQDMLDHYSMMNNGKTYEPYTSLPVGKPGIENWMGYENPFMINDHVFPNGNLTIAQLGTMEEWSNRNWSIGNNNPSKYIGHPFHIHINDYQVKDSDTELDDKRSLEDVTALNSTGYKYYDTESGQVLSLDPLKGELHSIPEALDPSKVDSLSTYGANDQTMRMLFQDYLGTYVFHCHILPHEDAGMMQVITIVENTDSSWIVAAEGFKSDQNRVVLHQAQDYQEIQLETAALTGQTWERAQSGDLNNDFVQDIALSAGGDKAGKVYLYDGSALQHGNSVEIASFTPYSKSTLAPWTFIEDFSGDGQRDLVTAGFDSKQDLNDLQLDDLELKAWLPLNDGAKWDEQFNFDPFDSIGFGEDDGLSPVENLTSDQISVAMADANLDNFQDVVISYAVDGGVRIIVIDGAALTLTYQTGQVEGGFFPNENILADAIFLDSELNDLTNLVVTSGFNSYAQSALENIVLTTESSSGTNQYTMQLQAGHFIATNVPGSEAAAQKGHGMHGSSASSVDPRITNFRNNALPLYLVEEQALPDSVSAVTPVISAGLGHGGTIVDDYAVVSQGNSANGNQANSDLLINNTQQLVIPLFEIDTVNVDDLTGIINSDSNSTFDSEQVRERYQLTSASYFAYTGKMLWPSELANQAAGILGTGSSAQDLVANLFKNDIYLKQINALYGAPLKDLDVEDIVDTAYQTLFDRAATGAELERWVSEVNSGTDRTLLPQAILQSASGDDQFRVAALSAASQWTALQWGTTAEVSGSFGQGLEGDLDTANVLDALVGALGSFDSWSEAQDAFNSYSSEALHALIGTPVSKSGFF
jgi:FtsP/CotA-like multicopper oxidase with cupredoxin domain